MSGQPSNKQLEAIVRRFNLTFTVGDYCEIQKDGKPFETILESPAKLMSGDRIVADFRGYDGWYDIGANPVRRPRMTPAA